MRIISRRALVQFWEVYADAKEPLKAWHRICESTNFENFAHLKRSCGSADKVGKFTIFNVGGNKYRLVTVIHYKYRKIYIRAVLTHAEYDLEHWKRE